MSARLLIINAASPYFFYIPMGTFGLCDYLDQHGIISQIVNPALYPEAKAEVLLTQTFNSFQPSHVAIVFHWQETAHGMQRALDLIHQWNPEIPTIAGGFTAGYFGADLLRSCPTLDFLIQGDPEVPLVQLLQGVPVAAIANLTYRKDKSILTSSTNWLIEQPTLDALSFTRLEFLHDASLYLETIRTKLGFPLFIGRGCIFNCEYCGGSRKAFSRHSHRRHPVARCISSIIRDLHRLKDWTDTLYICYENSPQYIMQLFQAIAADDALRRQFSLNYGAWHLIDQPFLEAYTEAFQCDGVRPIIEFSPEVISDSSRQKIKGKTTYSLEDLKRNCSFISKGLKHHVRLELFFSRYHPTESTIELLQQEIEHIYRLKHSFFKDGPHTVRVCYDHLSTDVASSYWQNHLAPPLRFDAFLEEKQRIDQQKRYPFPVDNLCLYIPETLPEHVRITTEALLQTLELIEHHCHELFHILFFCTDVAWIRCLDRIIKNYLLKNQVDFFKDIPLVPLLEDLAAAMQQERQYQHLSFLQDLVRFSTKKMEQLRNGLASISTRSGTSYLLAPEKISIHQHDYLDTHGFIHRLEQNDTSLTGFQRTVYLYLEDEVLALPHRSYRSTLKFFEQGGAVSTYLQHLHQTGTVNEEQQNHLLQRLIHNGVLIPLAE